MRRSPDVRGFSSVHPIQSKVNISEKKITAALRCGPKSCAQTAARTAANAAYPHVMRLSSQYFKMCDVRFIWVLP